MKGNPLEDAVLENNNALVIQEIAEGSRLQNPAVLASDEAFNLELKTFYVLMEIGSSAEVREEALAILHDMNPEDERIELLEEARQPLPTKPRAFERNLFKAILAGDSDALLKLMKTPSKRLGIMPSADVLKAFLKVDRKIIRQFLLHGVGFRCQTHLLEKFLQECKNPKDLADCTYEQRTELANLLFGVFMNDDGDDDNDGCGRSHEEEACGDQTNELRQQNETKALQEHVELCIRAYLERLELPFQFRKEKKCFFFPVPGRMTEYTLYANLMIEDFVVVYRGVLPILCPEERRMDMAEFLTRINCEITMGNYEMNFQTGNITIKVTLPHEAIASDPQKMLSLFMVTSDLLMGKYGPQLIAVLRGERSPEGSSDRRESDSL